MPLDYEIADETLTCETFVFWTDASAGAGKFNAWPPRLTVLIFGFC